MAGTTYTFADAAGSYLKYKATTVVLDGFTVNQDMPGENITPIGSSFGSAQSAGIAVFSGDFNGRLLVGGESTEQEQILLTSNAFLHTSATFCVSSRHNYTGDILITQKTFTGGGGQVAKISGTWIAGDDFFDDVS